MTPSPPGRSALLTDLYQLTMAYGYWKRGRAETPAVFHLFFRTLPFDGGYAIAAGTELVRQYVESFAFANRDTQYLAELAGNDDKPLFESAFLDYLRGLSLSVNIDAVPEGTVAFPHAPILRVEGPILQCQLLETALLNLVNFSTLIATKSARICQAAAPDPVLEFGLRRAQGPDGGLTASRAAFIGGCSATSNVLAGQTYGIPVKGTHAHSWVMSYNDELTAFEEYAAAMPNNCVLLVDTYDTIAGVHKACQIGQVLRRDGHQLGGIRLDSGDLAYLSIQAREILDEAGFADASIVASNDLDEHVVTSLKQQGARIDVWGIGTKLATAFDQPALGGVYKLGAMQGDDGRWQPKIKLSEQPIKTSIPGRLQVRRYFDSSGQMRGDQMHDTVASDEPGRTWIDPGNAKHRTTAPADWTHRDLLQPIVAGGRLVGPTESLPTMQRRAAEGLDALHPSIRRLLHPHTYPVGLDTDLFDRREQLMESR